MRRRSDDVEPLRDRANGSNRSANHSFYLLSNVPAHQLLQREPQIWMLVDEYTQTWQRPAQVATRLAETGVHRRWLAHQRECSADHVARRDGGDDLLSVRDLHLARHGHRERHRALALLEQLIAG